jgi:phosphoribosylformimino-5-aminoimidazole carboxamide ribotide isomerase
MLILPAIDLLGGRCVRLRQGDYQQETVFDEDPTAVALRFQKAGAQWLHVVDLDGARAGEPKNLDAIRAIAKAVSQTMSVEVGGGIRTTDTAAALFQMGIRRVIVGSRSVSNPEWLGELAAQFPGRVALGVDARGGRVAVQGWLEDSGRTLTDVLKTVAAFQLAAIIYTDIAQDGMMSGPNVEGTAALVKASRFPIIASGGVTTVDDIRRLKAVGVAGAIIGRALYEGTIRLEEALAAAQ